MSGDKRYVYGVMESEPLDLEVDGVCGTTSVSTVEHRRHAAVVADVDTLDPERTEENVRAHDQVLREVMMHGEGRTVVPMQFGMVFENDRALKNVLRSGRRAFTKALREADGMIELGVKVVAGEDGAVDADAIREDVEAELDPLSVRVSDDDQFSDRLVLNRSYLVEREDREAFDDAVARIRDAHEEVTVQYTGPWAPYNFVDIEIGVEQ
ncbi:protein gvpF [Halobacteriales archaeon QS_5_70_15]|nr:MAG: protein gvpF [Halobacteriales archaeon QS_5_70_15]